ncbi:MAG: Choline-sulfatase [candidate division BRC1 bacterium ADurb.BinA364]|nr:MAG: Choline-sulfatase [candidate division BRC1 bacterium ADurb.BinA364]
MPLIRACYSAEVTLVDRWIGHLLETIRLAGLMDNTVIVFTSDHGTEFHEHGVTMKHYFALYDTTTGLPLLIRHPDPATAGRTVDSLVSAVDFMPSWLSLIGAEPPAGQCPGIDFSPRLFGDSAPEREFCPIAYDGYGAARSRDWLYMFPLKGVEESYPEGEYDMRLVGGERLYDLKADPMQKTNLAGARPEMCRAMLERFASVWPEQA